MYLLAEKRNNVNILFGLHQAPVTEQRNCPTATIEHGQKPFAIQTYAVLFRSHDNVEKKAEIPITKLAIGCK